jgi:hypothetical protein
VEGVTRADTADSVARVAGVTCRDGSGYLARVTGVTRADASGYHARVTGVTRADMSVSVARVTCRTRSHRRQLSVSDRISKAAINYFTFIKHFDNHEGRLASNRQNSDSATAAGYGKCIAE